MISKLSKVDIFSSTSPLNAFAIATAIRSWFVLICLSNSWSNDLKFLIVIIFSSWLLYRPLLKSISFKTQHNSRLLPLSELLYVSIKEILKWRLKKHLKPTQDKESFPLLSHLHITYCSLSTIIRNIFKLVYVSYILRKAIYIYYLCFCHKYCPLLILQNHLCRSG